MHAHWVIESKFAPPRVHPHQIERASVIARLNKAEADVIVVHAPAGFGKSTLLAQWGRAMAVCGVDVAWLNLDEEDRYPEQFAAYVAAAVRRALGGSGEGLQTGLSPAGELLALVGEAARRGRRIGLVLEDYHRAECEELDALLRGFLERAPPWIRIAISSRSLPKLGVARLKAAGRAVTLTERDLRFNAGETRLFFDTALPAGNAEWTRFVERAEGWPVALQFARMWLSDGGDVAALGVASETSDLGAYLSDQVFSALRPEARDFLLRTSLLEEISPEVAEALGVGGRGPDRARRSPVRRCRLRSSRMSRCGCAVITCCAISSGAGARGGSRHRGAASAGGALVRRRRRAGLGGPARARRRRSRAGRSAVGAGGGWRLIYSGQGQLRAILRSVHAALPQASGFPGSPSPPRSWRPRAPISPPREACSKPPRATRRTAPSPTISASSTRSSASIAMSRWRRPRSMRWREAGRRMPADDPIGAALTSNLLAYFTLQSGGYIAAKRYATARHRAIPAGQGGVRGGASLRPSRRGGTRARQPRGGGGGLWRDARSLPRRAWAR